MTSTQRIGLGIGAVVLLLVVLYNSRAVWVAAIKRKWGKQFPFLYGTDQQVGGTLFSGVTDRQWNSYTLAELRAAYRVGFPYWWPDGSEQQAAATAKQKAIPNKRQANP